MPDSALCRHINWCAWLGRAEGTACHGRYPCGWRCILRRLSCQELVSFAQAALQPTGVPLSSVPIYLKATAGMRVLNCSQREAYVSGVVFVCVCRPSDRVTRCCLVCSILSEVRAYLSTTGFMFQDSWARVISGEEEGVYGWITVNYVNGLLGETGQTLGALDLGGASTQITYKASVDLLSNLYNVQLGSALNEDVYTHSFLYFGSNEAGRRAKQLTVDHTSPVAPGVYSSPCFYSGSSQSFTTMQGQTVTIRGSGDYASCRALLYNLLAKDALCLTAPNGRIHTNETCSIAGVYQPPLFVSSMPQ